MRATSSASTVSRMVEASFAVRLGSLERIVLRSSQSYDELVFSSDDEVRLLGVVVWFQASREESE